MYIRDGSYASVVGYHGLGNLAETVLHQCRPEHGPPRIEPDPEGKGLHPLIYRGVTRKRSRRPAVGDAQILLNRFLQRLKEGKFQCKPGANINKIQQIRSSLTADPLVVDCRYGPNTEKATRMFQRCVFPDSRKGWDGKIGPQTWRELVRLRVVPVPPLPPPPRPETFRERVRRLLQLLERHRLPGDSTGDAKQRVQCVLNKMLDPGVRDLYVFAEKNTVSCPKPTIQIPPPDPKLCPAGYTTPCGYKGHWGDFNKLPLKEQAAFFRRVRDDLRYKGLDKNAPVYETLGALDRLNERIFNSMKCLKEYLLTHERPDPTRRTLYEFIHNEQKDPRSIYTCYPPAELRGGF